MAAWSPARKRYAKAARCPPVSKNGRGLLGRRCRDVFSSYTGRANSAFRFAESLATERISRGTGDIWPRNISGDETSSFRCQCVVLDVLLDRKPHVEASAAAWAAVETGMAEGLLAAHAVTTIHYLVQKEAGAAKARGIVSAILRVFGIAAVNSAVIQEALQLSCSDFEDAVTAAAARLTSCDYIVTRDPKGFRVDR